MYPKVMEFNSAHPRAEDARTHRVTFKVSKRAGLAGPAGTPYVLCSCMGGENMWANLNRGNNVSGCWAMREARRAFNIPTPPQPQRRYW